jgi:hypothetical protein
MGVGCFGADRRQAPALKGVTIREVEAAAPIHESLEDSYQHRFFGTAEPMALIVRPVSLSLHHDSWGRPTIKQHGHLLFGERGGGFHHQVTLGLLDPGKSSCGHVVRCHGAFR